MKAKKKSSVALELMDDLLNSDSSKGNQKQKKKFKRKQKATQETTAQTQTVEDKTVELSELEIVHNQYKNANAQDSIRGSETPTVAQEKVHSPEDLILTRTEHLRIAQEKILDLETEIERLRGENESLAAAGETFKNKSDQLGVEIIQGKERYQEKIDSLQGERDILNHSLTARSLEIDELKRKTEEYEMRLSSSIQKIRVRERELENRLEILKVENAAVLRNKDEMILDLKREIDQYQQEIENYRAKTQELHNLVHEKKSTERRTVKALRMALAMLDGGDSSVVASVAGISSEEASVDSNSEVSASEEDEPFE